MSHTSPGFFVFCILDPLLAALLPFDPREKYLPILEEEDVGSFSKPTQVICSCQKTNKKKITEREQRETGQQTCQTKPLVCMQWIVSKRTETNRDRRKHQQKELLLCFPLKIQIVLSDLGMSEMVT